MIEPINVNFHYIVQLNKVDFDSCFQFKIVSLVLQGFLREAREKN